MKTTFNSRSYRGHVKKTIAVLSNDPDTPSYKLTLSGEIIEEITVKPRSINFGSFRADSQSDKTVKVSVTSQSGADFKITKVTSSKPFVETTAIEDQNGEFTVTATLKDYHTIGRFSGKIFLETNSDKQPQTSIIFYGVAEGDISINQKRVYFGMVPEGVDVTRKLFVKINENSVKILNTKISPKFLSVNVDEKYEDRTPHCLIEITLHKEAPVGKIDGLLELTTNSKEQPVINIPITGEVQKASTP